MNYACTDKVSARFARMSGEQLDNYSVSDRQGHRLCLQQRFEVHQLRLRPFLEALTDNLTVRADFTYYDYKSGSNRTVLRRHGALFKF